MPLSTAFTAGCRFRPRLPYISISVRPSTCELPKQAGSTTPGIHSPTALMPAARIPGSAPPPAGAGRPLLRYIEARHKDLRLGQRVDGARAPLRNPLGARVALVQRRGGQELGLGGLVQMRDLFPIAARLVLDGRGFLVLGLEK